MIHIGKILIISFSDFEENIMNKILTVAEGEKTMEYIQSPAVNILTFTGLEIHICEQAVYHNGTFVHLTHREFFTLLYLAQHPSWVFSKEQIYEAVWKENPEHCEAVVTTMVSQIRRKIGNEYIETVVGSGYRFVGK